MNEGQMVVEVVAPTLNNMMDTIASEVVAEATPSVVVVSNTAPLLSETVLNVCDTAPIVPTVVIPPVDIVAQTILAETPPKKKGKKKEKAKRKAGRPPVYNGTDRRIVAAALKKHGLTKGIAFLKAERNLTISMTLARSVAEQFELEFPRGRPKIAA
jgi:hypothetical protein